jgi:hypothetical protein
MKGLKNVNIADLVVVTATRLPKTTNYIVDITPLDKMKHVVFDTKALETMNEKISEKASQFEACDPRAKQYIEEFVSRMLPEMDRCGLLIYEDIPEASDDPYKEIKEKLKSIN